jgi:tripartite-type tricarboxylate transporter receptor subunit TctC
VIREDEIKKRFIADGGEPSVSRTPEEFAGVIRLELAKWAKVARAANIERQ